MNLPITIVRYYFRGYQCVENDITTCAIKTSKYSYSTRKVGPQKFEVCLTKSQLYMVLQVVNF